MVMSIESVPFPESLKILGVLNSDNTNILSITIDYGPYAFMDRYDPGLSYCQLGLTCHFIVSSCLIKLCVAY